MTRRLSALVPVAAALVLVTAAGSADAPTRTVTMPGKLYDPTQLSVLVGTSVTWKNDDSINHTVTADGDAFSSGYLPPGGAFTFTFAKQGRYAFHCTIHKFMRGEVDVFGLVLSGPEGPVASGLRVVFAGLAPPGTQSVTLRGAPTGDRVVRARPDGSFVAAVDTVVPGSFRAVAGRLVRAPRKGSVVVIEFSDGMHEYVTTPVKRVLRLAAKDVFYIETVNSRYRLEVRDRERALEDASSG